MSTLTLQPDATAGKDTTIRSFNPTFNYGTGGTVSVGYDSVSGGKRRPLLQFDLSSLPANAIIESAILTLVVTSEVDPIDVNLEIHRGLVAWFEGASNGAAPGAGVDGSTWNHKNANGSVSWGAAGGLAGTDYTTAPTYITSITGTGSFTWDVGADVQQFVSGGITNFGWWLIGLESGGTSTIKDIASSDSATAGNRPQLVVTYTVADSPAVFQPASGVGNDTFISTQNTAVNWGIRADFFAARSSLSVDNSGLIKFDITPLPAGITIVSAILSLYCTTEDTTTDYAFNIHRSLVTWYEGFQSGNAPPAGQDGSTWALRNANGSVAWVGGAGAHPNNDYAASATATTTVTGTGSFFDFDVTADIQSFYTGALTNLGWWLVGPVTVGARKIFASSDNTTAANRPKLTVTYYFKLEGSIAGTSTVTGHLRGVNHIEGSSAGTSTAFAQLITNFFSIGHITATSTVTGTLMASGYMLGNSFGDSTAAADIKASYHSIGTAAGTSAHVARLKGKFYLEGETAGIGSLTAVPSFEGQMRGASFGTSIATAVGYARARNVAAIIGCNPVPLLYITDGSIKSNGQLNILNFLAERSGYWLRNYRPQIAQYKDGGYWSSSPQSQGRRLRSKAFENCIDLFEVAVKASDQDRVIQYQQDLIDFQEAASDYWTSSYALLPCYLVARAARETNTRYAIIHAISCPELENPYSQPFFDHTSAVFSALTIRVEHGIWLSTPPGKYDCVEISGQREWTVSGWQAGS